jgi:hypothetical protein
MALTPDQILGSKELFVDPVTGTVKGTAPSDLKLDLLNKVGETMTAIYGEPPASASAIQEWLATDSPQPPTE